MLRERIAPGGRPPSSVVLHKPSFGCGVYDGEPLALIPESRGIASENTQAKGQILPLRFGLQFPK